MIARARNPQRRAELEAELAIPPMPDELGYIWNAFLRLNARRSVGFALEPITFLEIEAFVRLTGQRLQPWEVRILEEIDLLFRSVHATKKGVSE